MKKKKHSFSGSIETVYPEIYLKIDDLKMGTYLFHIVQKDKIIKTFKVEKRKLPTKK